MPSYSRSHLADHVLLRALTTAVTQDRATTAEMLALIAEVEHRRLYAGEGFSSMYRYCVEKLLMSEDVACKRILTARAARRFAAIIPAIAEGRLTVSTVALLSTHLKTEHGGAILSQALGKTRADVELLIAERFPKPDVPTTLVPVACSAVPTQVEPPQNDTLALAEASAQVVANTDGLSAPGRITPVGGLSNSAPSEPLEPQRRVAPLSPGRFELRLTISQDLHDKLKRAQELLGHAVPSGDIPQLLERALDVLIAQQEKLKFAATNRPRAARGPTQDPRHISAEVRRAVRIRDEGRCTYVSESGHRCQSRTRLEYDHEIPVARGGTGTVANLRLRCRAHNQLEAERTFGAGFMEEKRARNGSRVGRTYN